MSTTSFDAYSLHCDASLNGSVSGRDPLYRSGAASDHHPVESANTFGDILLDPPPTEFDRNARHYRTVGNRVVERSSTPLRRIPSTRETETHRKKRNPTPVTSTETVLGYPFDIFSEADVSNGKQNACVICTQVARTPMRAKCGHLLCQGCLLRFKDTSRASFLVCPGCISSNDVTEVSSYLNENEVFQINEFNEPFYSTEVSCGNKPNGCGWKGSLMRYKVHACKYNSLDGTCTNSCPFCKVPISKGDVTYYQRHVSIYCTTLPSDCPSCKETIPLRTRLDHFLHCSKWLLQCRVCKKSGIERDEIHAHLRTCKYPRSLCACGELIELKRISDHFRTCPKCLLGQVRHAAITSKDDTHEHLPVILAEIRNELNEQKRMVEEKQRMIDSLGRTQELALMFCSIHEFGVQRNLIYESNPFFCRGYTLRIQVYREENYLTVYLHLMKSEYDAFLDWPFHPQVNTTFLKVNGATSVVIRLSEDVYEKFKEVFDKPTEHMAPGCPVAEIPLCDIEDPSNGFLEDDVLRIRIEVVQAVHASH